MDIDWRKLSNAIKRTFDGQFFDGARCIEVWFDFDKWDNGQGIVIVMRLFLDKEGRVRRAPDKSYELHDIQSFLERELDKIDSNVYDSTLT